MERGWAYAARRCVGLCMGRRPSTTRSGCGWCWPTSSCQTACGSTTTAKRVYVCNLRAEAAETRGYDVAGHVAALRDHGIEPDVVLVQADGQLEIGEVQADVVLADVARPHGMAHDSTKLATALAGLLPSS